MSEKPDYQRKLDSGFHAGVLIASDQMRVELAKIKAERDAMAAALNAQNNCRRCGGRGVIGEKHGTTYCTDSADEIEFAYHDVPCPYCRNLNPAQILAAHDADKDARIVEMEAELGTMKAERDAWRQNAHQSGEECAAKDERFIEMEKRHSDAYAELKSAMANPWIHGAPSPQRIALADELKRVEAERDALAISLKELAQAALNCRHWHHTGKDNEGTIIATASWRALHETVDRLHDGHSDACKLRYDASACDCGWQAATYAETVAAHAAALWEQWKEERRADIAESQRDL